MSSITRKAVNAFKWSAITEIVAKLISPLINMLLARILAPEDFGILATVMMTISLAEVFAESGFQKFLIQRKFEPQEEEQYTSVAFWSSLIFAFFAWGIITVFRVPISRVAGSEGKEFLLVIAGMMIPLFSIAGILEVKIRKALDFHKLFPVRIASALTPLLVTVPLALAGLGYWALLIGNIAGVLGRVVLLYVFGRYRPKLYYSFQQMKKMLSISIWTMLDRLTVWATNWIDSLLITAYMTEYYLGLYRNSTGMLMSIFTLVTAAVSPVLFSSLSKMTDPDEFNTSFLSVQKVLGILIIPMGVGLFLYSDFATMILFGSAWTEASRIVGIFSVTTAARLLFVSIYSDVYRAKGKFHIPMYLQIVDLLLLVPTCLISVRKGFWVLVYARALMRLNVIIPELFMIRRICGIRVKKILSNLFHPMVATLAMTLVALLLKRVAQGIIWDAVSVCLCVVLYFAVLLMFKEERTLICSTITLKAKKNRHMV